MKQENTAILKVPTRYVAVATVSLPLSAFFTCLYLSLRNEFKSSTATHCGVRNYLPSISSAIGEFVPQRHIWRVAIAFHSAPRFMFIGMYYKFLKKSLPTFKVYKILIGINMTFSVAENAALLGLSFVSSKENYDIHKFFFASFMIFSEMYMLLSCLLLKEASKSNHFERVAYWYKKRLMAFNISAFFLALYFFNRHNSYCEPGMYTMFSLFEYFVVLTNMAFHMTAYYDFYDCSFIIGQYAPLPS